MRLARRATRRLPLGEPPLVITTHAITSFRSSLPEPAGDQPRAGSGSSPSCHGSTTRKSVEGCVSVSTDNLTLSNDTAGFNSLHRKNGLVGTHHDAIAYHGRLLRRILAWRSIGEQ